MLVTVFQSEKEENDLATAHATNLVTSESVSVSLKRAKSWPFWAYLAPTEIPVSMKLVTSWRFTLMLNLVRDKHGHSIKLLQTAGLSFQSM